MLQKQLVSCFNTRRIELGCRMSDLLLPNKPPASNRPYRLALVAHDNKKPELLSWASANQAQLAGFHLLATGTTGRQLEDKLGLIVTRLQSGPLGGDQQIGARIVDGEIDMLVFFWDPLEPQPHDPDVKALLRMAVVWNIPMACNRATADFLISSPLMQGYERDIPDFSAHQGRPL
jgi:methylglyoxal synthase